VWCKKDAYGLLNSIVHVSLVPLSAHDTPTAAALPTVAPLVAVPETVPAVLKQVNEPAMYNAISAAAAQLRNLDREFRAERIGIDEYRPMKKMLTGE
jgi:hypothetical protein